MRINNISNRYQNFGAYLSYPIQRLIKDAKDGCATEEQLEKIRALTEDLYALCPDSELNSIESAPSFLDLLLGKPKRTTNIIYVDDVIICELEQNENVSINDKINNIRIIHQKLKEYEMGKLDIES